METWDLYTVDREKTERTMVRGEEQPLGTYRLVVHVCIFNGAGEMLIQQRQHFKKGWPGMWDLSVGGSAVSGDTSRTAAERETLEELGLEISLDGIAPSLTVHFDYGFDDFYLLERDVDLDKVTLQEEEVAAAAWASEEKILSMIDTGEFIPYHKSLISLLFSMREQRGAQAKKN